MLICLEKHFSKSSLKGCVPLFRWFANFACLYQRDGARVPAATLELLGRALKDGVLKCGTKNIFFEISLRFFC